jgi:hypothetical protein
MKEKTTKGQLKKLAGVKTDAALVRWITKVTGRSITPQSVHNWGPDDAAIPDARHREFKLLRLEGKI